jgi:CRISP-associated protein Cas1
MPPDLAANEPITIDHLHQYAYCPRRAHLMYVDGRWDDNLYTDEGRAAHSRVDSEEDVLPTPQEGGDEPPVIARSVMLSSETLGLIGKLDLVETDGGIAAPVDTKRGKPPNTPEQCYEPERIQLMAQGLLLREHGYAVSHGELYFAGARKRIRVEFTADLELRTAHLLHAAQVATHRTEPPQPLEESPKCWGCSLGGICLPDETHLLAEADAKPIGDIRRLYPARDDALPLYVQEQGARVGKRGEGLTVTKGGSELGHYPLKDVSQLVLCGNIGVSAQALHLLCERGIPTAHLSMGGWFYGITNGMGLRNAYDRAAQFSAAADEGRRLNFATETIRAKGMNQRTLLRRNGGSDARDALRAMRRELRRITLMTDCESLLGLEGSIAAAYFGAWPFMIRDAALRAAFDFRTRNRRPPRDPINALLSFGYAVLAKECTIALLSEGLDPWWGLYHRPRHGRPALALDLMETFRPLIVDSAVLTTINTGMVTPSDFVRGANGCAMKPSARKAILKAYEMRLDQLVTHPIFDYRCSWRAVIRLQARLLAKWLRGDVPRYTGITTR